MQSESDNEVPEQEISRLLRAAGPREQVPPAMQKNWEQAFRTELKTVVARRRSRSWQRIGAVAAVLLVALYASQRWWPQTATPATSVRVVTVSGRVHADGKPVQLDAKLAATGLIEVGPDSHLSLDFGGYDLRLREGSRARLSETGLQLLAGTLYASDELRKPTLNQLEVTTEHGRIVDVGTQFLVHYSGSNTVATVRRGTLDIQAGAAGYRLEADSVDAIRLVFDGKSLMEESRTAASGEDWSWIHTGAPPFELEGSSAHDFLNWISLETGYRLVFADDATEIYSRATTLHGSVGDLQPEQALTAVIATTDLEAVLSIEGQLQVRLER